MATNEIRSWRKLEGEFTDMSEEEDDILKGSVEKSKEGGGSTEKGDKEGGKLGWESSNEILKASYKESVLGNKEKNCLEEVGSNTVHIRQKFKPDFFNMRILYVFLQ